MFSDAEPPRDLISLVAKRVPQLKRGEVRSSLLRARATFDFPTATVATTPGRRPVNAGESAAEVPPRSPMELGGARTGRADPRPRVAVEERKLHVRDVMASGLLAAGAELEADYAGQRYTAQLLVDGTVRFRGEAHHTPSGAGRAVKLAALGPDTPNTTLATDGWAFWRARDSQTGDLVSLKELRRQAASLAL